MAKKYNQGVADANRRRAKHGGTVDMRQGKGDKLYKIWVGIKQRCYNPNEKHYHRYGGRGITMYPEWVNDYGAFKAYVGDAPTGMTLDRIDNDKGYEPDNLRWVSRKTQANNRVTNVTVTHNGLTMTLKQWSEHLGWKYGLIASRWKKGIRGDELFAEPKYTRSAKYSYNGEMLTISEIAEKSGIPYSTVVYKIKEGKL